jgi:hypothetical protein
MSNEMAVAAGGALFTKVNGMTAQQAADLECHRKFLEKAKSRQTTLRPKLVRKVRAKIGEGCFENDLKLTVAADRVLDVLNGKF